MPKEEENLLSRFADLSASQDLPRLAEGEVWIIGAGAGELGLLTLHGLNGLQQADIVLHDSLIAPAILSLAKNAQLEYVGKRAGVKKSRGQKDISRRLIELARLGKKVVRLKGGDPGIFGRGGEEVEALIEARIPCKIFAGVSAGLAAAHVSGLSLTHRTQNHVVSFITGHDAELLDWDALVVSKAVLVIYMPQDYNALQQKLLAAGMEAQTLTTIISSASLPPKEHIIHTQLSELGVCEKQSPALIIIGARRLDMI